MKVLLIQPPYPFSEFPKPSSALIFLGTVLRQAGVEVEILDLLSTRYSVQKIEQRLSRFQPDIIGATSVTLNLRENTICRSKSSSSPRTEPSSIQRQ